MNKNNHREDDLFLFEVIKFILDGWKNLILAGLAGALLGYSGWAIFGIYQAEVFIRFNPQVYSFESKSWPTMQQILADYVNNHSSGSNISKEQSDLFKHLREPTWWSKNVIPRTEILNSDIKEPQNSKNLNISYLIGLHVMMQDRSQDAAIKNLNQAVNLIKQGVTYSEIKKFINFLEFEVKITSSNIADEIYINEYEQAYLRDRLKDLEDLIKRFPENAKNPASNLTFQIEDNFEKINKYLPLNVQAIATRIEIDEKKAALKRLGERLNKINVYKTFLSEAWPIINQELEVKQLIKALLMIEEKLQKNLSPSNIHDRATLKNINHRIQRINFNFMNGSDAGLISLVKKNDMVKSILAGMAVTVLLMIIILSSGKYFEWIRERNHEIKKQA